MKQGKRPTRRQKHEIKAAGLNADNWLVERDVRGEKPELIIIHRVSGKTRNVRRVAQ
ncbi:hypothetical protein KIH86_23065 [Paenibacillus sp. HN-1]|uniref:DUF6906 family protein n=1 Tax=Paenibacillus TaxID=44249 RepID=UPI001CA8DA7F|nr:MULTISPECIES: hypothetical protein [Paenibacillus]MBY9081037.1 hypothetical protein [Paenibacillus sp. CGMCC 1.18879]MBY9087074.1 hypothetical protein [Paenibacillus sinensis]